MFLYGSSGLFALLKMKKTGKKFSKNGEVVVTDESFANLFEEKIAGL
jgi:hypothetical protein